MYLERMNYLEVEEYLRHNDAIIIPVGSLENHGKHMPLGTDTMIPNEIARMIDGRSDIVIAPTVNYASTDDLVGFAGTVSLGVDGLMWLLGRIIDQLYAYGFRRFLVLNGHGGNVKAIESCGVKLYRKGGIMAVLNWWLMAGQIDPRWKGGHGGGEETAAVMAIDPTLIKREYLDAPENIRADLKGLKNDTWTSVKFNGASITVPRPMKSITDNGWLAYGMPDAPTRASEDWGKEMLSTVADTIADFIKVFRDVELPTPEENR